MLDWDSPYTLTSARSSFSSRSSPEAFLHHFNALLFPKGAVSDQPIKNAFLSALWTQVCPHPDRTKVQIFKIIRFNKTTPRKLLNTYSHFLYWLVTNNSLSSPGPGATLCVAMFHAVLATVCPSNEALVNFNCIKMSLSKLPGLEQLFYYYLSWFLRRRQWHSPPVLLPRQSHGLRSLVGCSLWGR